MNCKNKNTFHYIIYHSWEVNNLSFWSYNNIQNEFSKDTLLLKKTQSRTKKQKKTKNKDCG